MKKKVKTPGGYIFFFNQAKTSWEKGANMSHRHHLLLCFQSSEAQRLLLKDPALPPIIDPATTRGVFHVNRL